MSPLLRTKENHARDEKKMDHCNDSAGLGSGSDPALNCTAPQPPAEPCTPDALLLQRVLPALYLLVFLGGVLLNGVSGWVFCYVPSSKSFIVYLKNIVVADFLMSLTFPFKILSDAGLGPWQLAVFVCRASAVLFYVNMYVGIVFFGLIGFDRYYKIVKPLLTSAVQSVAHSRVLAATVWLLMLLLAVPNIILTDQGVRDVTRVQCMELKNPLGLQWHKASNYVFVSLFWVVFLLLVVFYTAITRKIFQSHLKSRRNSVSVQRKSSRNIFSIMFVFFVCFVPYHVARISYTQSQTGAHFGCQAKRALQYAKEFTLLLSAANVCLDPIIYFFLCQPFREMLCKKLRIPQRAPQDLETSRARRGNVIQESTETL